MSEPWITVTTTLPQSLGSKKYCKGAESALEIRTERLIIRPLTQSDLISFHRLRSEPAFMEHTTKGVPDPDIATTQQKLDSLLNAPNNKDEFPFPTYFGIFLKSTGELIGDGGVHVKTSRACGWPELGCKFGSEFCGHGYGPEFVRGFTAWWWTLPRCSAHGGDPVPVRLRVCPESVVWDRRAPASGNEHDARRRRNHAWNDTAVEMLYAWITPDNYASQMTVIKDGWEHFINWEHPVKKIPVMGWRRTRPRCSAYPSKL